MATKDSRIVELAKVIAKNVTDIDAFLQAEKHPLPSFGLDGPATILPQSAPADIVEKRISTLESLKELRDLMEQPANLLRPSTNMSSLQTIYRFRMAFQFPVGGEISYKEMAERCNLYEYDVRRIIRYAIAFHHVFCEPREGYIAHSAASRALVERPLLHDSMGMEIEECYPAYAKTTDALEKFRKSQEPNETGFAIANNTKLPFYAFISQYPERSKRIASVMSMVNDSSPEFLATNFPPPPPNAIIIDVGGSRGHVSSFLAQKFPSAKFIVQDLPAVISDKNALFNIPDELKDRVSLMEHDFFNPQPVEGADIYLYRYIMHNWPDAYCIKILQALIPALKKGSKIVINDGLLPKPGTMSPMREQLIRSLDMTQLSMNNSRERDSDDWKILFEAADSRFKYDGVVAHGQAESAAVIVATWEPAVKTTEVEQSS